MQCARILNFIQHGIFPSNNALDGIYLKNFLEKFKWRVLWHHLTPEWSRPTKNLPFNYWPRQCLTRKSFKSTRGKKQNASSQAFPNQVSTISQLAPHWRYWFACSLMFKTALIVWLHTCIFANPTAKAVIMKFSLQHVDFMPACRNHFSCSTYCGVFWPSNRILCFSSLCIVRSIAHHKKKKF